MEKKNTKGSKRRETPRRTFSKSRMQEGLQKKESAAENNKRGGGKEGAGIKGFILGAGKKKSCFRD